MKEITSTDELKSIQLEILIAFDKFCSENGINYSIAAGTLIGAIRHKGFIPWDDDIDVYLLRKDYKKLISVFPNRLKDFALVSMEREKKWHRPYGKIFDCRTLMIENFRNRFEGQGVGIDVFPIDDVPDSVTEWTIYNKRRILLRNIYMLKSLTLSTRRGLAKNLLVILSRLALFPFSFSVLTKWINSYSQKHNNKGYMHVYENCLGLYDTKKAWLKKDMECVEDALFEGHYVKVMKGYDDYLTTIYGNYMQLPPQEKRITHHAYKAFWL